VAQFIGKLEGRAKNPRTVLGTKSSGICAEVRGWGKGIRVSAEFDEEAGEDVLIVYEIGGSRKKEPPKVLKIIRDRSPGPPSKGEEKK